MFDVRTNERIRISPVLVIKDDQNLGVMPTMQALRLAREAGLDLVEVNPQARPPVCRIIEFGKFRYEQTQKEKLQKKRPSEPKEVQLSPVIGEHDLQVKIKAVMRFLEEGRPVVVRMLFKARQITHKDIGRGIVNRMIDEVEAFGVLVKTPSFQGNTLMFTLNPKK